jgi:hypothetical protein
MPRIWYFLWKKQELKPNGDANDIKREEIFGACLSVVENDIRPSVVTSSITLHSQLPVNDLSLNHLPPCEPTAHRE